jgi:hypothetical protein
MAGSRHFINRLTKMQNYLCLIHKIYKKQEAAGEAKGYKFFSRVLFLFP